MKKGVVSFLLAISFACAEDCRFVDFFDIYFTDSTIWYNEYSFFDGSFVVDSLSEWIDAENLPETLEDGYQCYKKGYRDEKAFLDSNVFLHREKRRYRGVDDMNTVVLFGLSVANHRVGDVFKDEFLHWQQCGMLNLTYEEADSLVTPLAKALNEHLANDSGYSSSYESDCFFAGDFPVGSEFPDKFIKWRDEICKTEGSILQKNSSNEKLIFGNGLVRVPCSLQGETYFVLDLNGRVIRKGIAGEIIRMPAYPAILKVGAQRPVLFKN